MGSFFICDANMRNLEFAPQPIKTRTDQGKNMTSTGASCHFA
jgi:hypothetical protein